MSQPEIRKQVNLMVPISEWNAIHAESARQGVTISTLLRRWIEPQVKRLRKQKPEAAK